MRCFTRVALLVFCLLAISCEDKGPGRLRISGEVLFNGQAVPYGDVLFTPDGANPGPQGIANIRDGKFDTSSSGGKGIAGGPTTVRVTGLSGENGKLLCEYEYKVDLPKADSTLKIEVPASAAPGKKVTPPEI